MEPLPRGSPSFANPEENPAGPEAAGRSWHIRQGRRLRGDALQYFDNPGFGVILAVRPPAGTSEPDPAAAADEEP